MTPGFGFSFPSVDAPGGQSEGLRGKHPLVQGGETERGGGGFGGFGLGLVFFFLRFVVENVAPLKQLKWYGGWWLNVAPLGL